MNDFTFQYRCNACGHTWVWAYQFVVKCRVCKKYYCFNEVAVNPSAAHTLGAPEEYLAFQAPLRDDPIDKKSTVKGNGNHSRIRWQVYGNPTSPIGELIESF